MLEGDILYSIETLPPFSETSRRVVEILGDPDRSLPDIVDVIKYDQSITANLLRMCNSAYFGFVRKVTSLEQAVSLMGHQTVLELAMISGSLTYYNQGIPGYRVEGRGMLRHSISCALLSQILGGKKERTGASILFTAGLLHDIGKVVLSSLVRDRFVEILNLVEEENYSFVEAEREVLGMDHAQVGGEVARKWGLPETIRNPIAGHHDFERVRQGDWNTIVIYIFFCSIVEKSNTQRTRPSGAFGSGASGSLWTGSFVPVVA
ncbi:MAG: HDOD domain-containing protein [Deltaproteobacteria bacterium]|nr:HDOD domain-containing protein [Deltaproteobacteria bacterium]